MKYIRTKDGIYALCGDYKLVNENGTLLLVWVNEKVIEKTRGKSWNNEHNVVIKQAKTVEELCDRYYGVDENGDVYRVHNWSNAYPPKPHEWAVEGFCTKEDITIDELKKRFPKGIFGAVVWFDDNDNLHIDIVAKMNDKGDLELL